MKNAKHAIPSTIFSGNNRNRQLVDDIKNLSVGDLIERYAFAESIVETVREPLIVLDNTLHVKSVNKAFYDTFHMSTGDTIGKYIYELNGGEWNIPELKRLLENVLPRSSYFNDFEVRHNFDKLGKKVMLLNARQVVLEENKVQLILLAIEDVTDRITLGEQKEEFMSIASHELKTPLTTIKAYTQILEKRLAKTGDKDTLNFLSKIDSQSDKIAALINDLLDADKIEAGRMVLNKTSFNLNSLIDSIISDLQHTTEKHEIVKEGRIKLTIHADEDWIGQVLMNMVTNAIKYSPDGGTITVRLTENEKDITLAVQDFGMGISQTMQKQLFRKYFRVKENNSGYAHTKGFGLGLYISSQIIERHGGRMWAESKTGKGSTFYFSLPKSK